MSKDIRSFFSVIPKNTTATTTNTTTKKRAIVLDSSDDDVIEASPLPVKTKVSSKLKKRKLIDSDSDDENKEKGDKDSTKSRNKDVKKVSAADVFGRAPIKQTRIEKKPKESDTTNTHKESKKVSSKSETKPKIESELGIHDDPDFEQTLLDLDNDILLDNISVLDKTIEEALSNRSISMSSNKKENDTPKPNKRKAEDYEDTGIDKDQERYEKKRHSAMLYQKYLNRSGPINRGSKEYPKGKPECLKGLCFLRTGVLDSLDNEEFQSLIQEHGGRTVHSVSKKVNYVVVGEEAGPAKLEKARTYGIPNISEDELLDLILTKSGMPAKYVKGMPAEEEELAKEKVIPSPKKSPPKKPKIEEEKKSVYEKMKTNEKKPNLKKLDESIQKDTANIEKTPPESKEKEHPESKEKVSTIKINKEGFYGKKEVNKINDIEKNNEKVSAKPVTAENLSWADKYKPKDIKGIIGQQGDKSNMRKLLLWLSKWPDHHSGKSKTKLVKPSPWAKNDDGAYFKAALLSGPPGVGKTTTATLVAKELGYDVVEFNASDTRSKRLLNEEVSQLLSTNSLADFFKDGSAPTKKHVLLMDEVDGMAGNEDRGGMQELINLIKKTNIPIICMCNDRNHQKVRSLANYCFDLRFPKPRLEQIRGAMMSVCFKEGLKIPPDALSQIISGTEMDIRQTFNHLSLWTISNKTLSAEEARNEAVAAKKDTILGPWEVVRKVFSAEEHKTMTIADKFRLFFYDYSIGPLFVQENYLQVQPHCSKRDLLQRVADTADAISYSDLIDKKMRSSNNWSLLEIQALFSSVLPGHYMTGHMKGQINFPSWLGKNSKKGKIKRLVSELQNHTRICTSGSRKSINLDYAYHLRDNIVAPLRDEGTNGVEKSLNVMHSYNLLRQDFDSILDVTHWARQKDPMAMVDSRVKMAFTRAYNKENVKLPYAVSSGAVKKKSAVALEENPYDEEEDIESSPEEDDVTKDAMIKTKKPAKTKPGNKEASSSKKGGSSGKGRGSKKSK